ncbi:MAG: type I restriction endonuclease [Polyangia bacterium]
MTTPLDAFMAHARTLSAKYSNLHLSEADTRSYLIDPVLRLLGYEGVENLRREVPISATKEFIDYELLVRGAPHVLIEAKALRHDLADQHAAQCVQYAAVLGVRWCFITNGLEWLLYDATAKGPLAKKRVAAVKLEDTDASCVEAWRVLSLFARDELERQMPINSLLIQRVIEDELSDAESSIVNALRHAVQVRFGERVTSADVVVVAKRLMRPNDGPSNLPRPPEEPAQPVPTPREPRNPSDPKKRHVTIGDLVAAGLLPEGASIEAIVKGVTHVARVAQGRIELEGQVYDSPSAASMAIRKVESWNGWIDWKYKGEMLSDLRLRLPPTAGAARPTAV